MCWKDVGSITECVMYCLASRFLTRSMLVPSTERRVIQKKIVCVYVCVRVKKTSPQKRSKEHGHEDQKSKVSFPATILANQQFSVSGYRPIGLLGVESSANQGFSLSGYRPMRFLGVGNSANQTPDFRPVGFLEGLSLANHVFLTFRFVPIEFLDGLSSTNRVFKSPVFRPMGYLEGLSSTNHIFSPSDFSQQDFSRVYLQPITFF